MLGARRRLLGPFLILLAPVIPQNASLCISKGASRITLTQVARNTENKSSVRHACMLVCYR